MFYKIGLQLRDKVIKYLLSSTTHNRPFSRNRVALLKRRHNIEENDKQENSIMST